MGHRLVLNFSRRCRVIFAVILESQRRNVCRYMEELSDALLRVLDHCAQLDRRRLAGYAANIDFWVSERQHRLLSKI